MMLLPSAIQGRIGLGTVDLFVPDLVRSYLCRCFSGFWQRTKWLRTQMLPAAYCRDSGKVPTGYITAFFVPCLIRSYLITIRLLFTARKSVVLWPFIHEG